MSDIKINLIHIVRNHPEIWDKRHGNHHNRYVLSKNWKKIATEIGCTEKFAKTTWKKLRQEYGRKLSKSFCDPISDETPSSSWPYFGSLSFIKDQFTPRETPTQPSSFFKNEIEDADEENRSDAYHPESYGNEDFGAIGDSFISRSSPEPASPASCNETRSGYRKGTSPQVTIGTSLSPLERGKPVRGKRDHHNLDPSDEDVCFFNSLLTHVKKLNGEEKMIFRMETQKLLFNLAYRKPKVSTETSRPDTDVAQSGSYSMPPVLPTVRLSSPSRDLV